MSSRLVIEQLQSAHLSELATHLLYPEVYEHIGGLPTLEEFVLDRENAIRGPNQQASTERWPNFLVREASTNQMLGRLEATLHDSIAEVAFLFSPKRWGNGFATEALAWLHREVQDGYDINDFWATTIPENARCQALLLRAGYKQVHSRAPILYSYDEGDLVFCFRGAA